jgi:hypothetical protein
MKKTLSLLLAALALAALPGRASAGRLFAVASSQEYTAATSGTNIPTSLPFTMVGFARQTTATASCIVGIGTNTTNAARAFIAVTATGQANAEYRMSSSSAGASTTTTVSPGTWVHVAGVFENTSSRYVLINGGDKTSNVLARNALSGIDLLSIGNVVSSSANQLADADIAHVAIWSSVLTDTEIGELAEGKSPLLVSTHTLTNYWPLPGIVGGERDVVGGVTLTAVNGPTKGENPPLFFFPRAVARVAIENTYDLEIAA